MSRAIVIGGGPAGSLAAILLARGGMSVVVVEQHRFPRDKVCGECVSDLGRQVLRRYGLEAGLAEVGRAIDAAVLVGGTRQVRLALPRPMLGVSRAGMDATLLAAATAEGVDVRQPARAEAIDVNGDGVAVRVRDLADNRVTAERAEWVIIADGRGALLAERPAASRELGVKAHFTGVSAAADAVTLYGGFGCYGGVAPIEGGRWNAAFAVSRALVTAGRGDLENVWRRLLSESAVMRAHFARAERVGEWLASPLPRHRSPKRIDGRVVPVGAAACAIEPIGGEGMGTTLRSAELAAEAILAGDVTPLAASYAGLWRRRSLFCQLGGKMLNGPTTSDAVALAATPVVGRAAMWLVGK